MRKYSKTISVNADIDLDMREIETDDLVEELKRRGKEDELRDEDFLPKFKTTDDLLKYLNKVVGLKPWHTKEKLIKEISEL
jgi:hypothetical protein